MADYLFPKYQVVNAGSPLTIAPYATATADPDERLWEKRAFFWEDGVAYPYMRCYFEVDEDSVTTLGLPPAGKRLKINDGTKTYRVITQMTYNRGKLLNNSATKSKTLLDYFSGYSAEYKLDLEDNLPVGRRSYWYDTSQPSDYNYKNLMIKIYLNGYDTYDYISAKIEVTYTKGDGSVVTATTEYGPLHLLDNEFEYMVYPKPGSNVNIKIYHKGNVSSYNDAVYFYWLEDY